MKSTMRKLLALFPLILLGAVGYSQETNTDFGGQKYPYHGTALVKSVDFETSQNIDILLPKNFTYIVESVQTVVRTAPSAVTTAPRVGLSSYDGTTATIKRGTVAASADTAGDIDFIFKAGTVENGYQYTEDVAAATTTGNCTQVTATDTPAALASLVSPLFPRKIVVTTTDGAGDDLAGTVTLVGKNAQGEVITEAITVVAGTDSVTSTSAFSVLTSGSFDFGETGTAAADTLDLGMSVQQALPQKNARVYKVLTAGAADTVAAQDVAEGTFSPTDAADGATEQEIYYRVVDVPFTVAGGNYLRVVVTGGTVTGSDVRDVLVTFLKY